MGILSEEICLLPSSPSLYQQVMMYNLSKTALPMLRNAARVSMRPQVIARPVLLATQLLWFQLLHYTQLLPVVILKLQLNSLEPVLPLLVLLDLVLVLEQFSEV